MKEKEIKRAYQEYSWGEIMKIRDSLQLLCDTTRVCSREWRIFDEELVKISDEIDYIYKNGRGKK